MQSSRLSRFVSRSSERWWVRGITWVVRIFTGAVFLLSGFAKGVDPWGTVYKIQEYLNVLGMHDFSGVAVPAAFLLCGGEFLIGAFLFLGCFRRGSAVCAFLVMCFMLPFSAWIALANPVSDCGCFGDAVVLSNAETFWKNVLLILCAAWLVLYNRKVHWCITPALQWFAAVALSVFIFYVEYTGYASQPFVDFRPYKVGSALMGAQSEGDEPEYAFVYVKDGEERQFALDSLPDESQGWVYKERVMLSAPEVSGKLGVGNLHLWDGDADVTSDVLSAQGKMILLTVPDVDHSSPASAWKINALADRAARTGAQFVAAVSGNSASIDAWRDATAGDFGIYTADDTALKEMVRGEPGVVEIEDGSIVWKSTLKNVDGDEVNNSANDALPLDELTYLPPRVRNLPMVTLLLSAVLAFLMLLSFSTKLPFAQRIKRREERMKRVQAERKALHKLHRAERRRKGIRHLRAIRGGKVRD